MLELEDLPLELIEHIAHQLDAGGLRAFRSTSKRYENASFKALANNIRQIRFALAPWSLPTLLDIARQPTIAQRIEVVRLSKTLLDCNEWDRERIRQERFVEDSDDEDDLLMPLAAGESAFYSYSEPQREFVKEGGAKEMLSEILTLLPNLKAVAFGRWELAAEDMYNDKLNYFQKDMDNHTRSYRFPVREAEMHQDAYMPKDEGFREVNVVLQALAESRKPIEGLYIRSYSLYENWIDLQRVARIVPPLSEGLAEAFKHLRTLHLSVGENQEYLYQDEKEDEEALDDNDDFAMWLADFLALTPQVEDLTLSFHESRNGDVVFSEFVSQVDLPKLKKFGLHFIFVDHEDLKAFLLGHRSTLQEVTLRHCCFVNYQWSQFLSDTFLGTDWMPSITVARMAQLTGNDTQPSSVLFDTDHLLDCCTLGCDSWALIRGLDCEHVNRTITPQDIPNLKMSIVAQSDPKYKEAEEESNRRLEEARAKRLADGTLSQELVERRRRIRDGEETDESESEDDREDEEDNGNDWEDVDEEDDDDGHADVIQSDA